VVSFFGHLSFLHIRQCYLISSVSEQKFASFSQEGSNRLFGVISKRDRALFLTAYHYGVDTPAGLPRLWVPGEASQLVL
jgi:hypothetical protein